MLSLQVVAREFAAPFIQSDTVLDVYCPVSIDFALRHDSRIPVLLSFE